MGDALVTFSCQISSKLLLPISPSHYLMFRSTAAADPSIAAAVVVAVVASVIALISRLFKRDEVLAELAP